MSTSFLDQQIFALGQCITLDSNVTFCQFKDINRARHRYRVCLQIVTKRIRIIACAIRKESL